MNFKQNINEVRIILKGFSCETIDWSRENPIVCPRVTSRGRDVSTGSSAVFERVVLSDYLVAPHLLNTVDKIEVVLKTAVVINQDLI